MGRVYDRARLDRRGELIESDWSATFRTRRSGRFTVWDWCHWWSGNNGQRYIRSLARECNSSGSIGIEAVALQHAQNARSARFQLGART